MSLGGVGVISVAANILPEEMHDMCSCYLKGNISQAQDIQLKTLDVINKLFIEVNPVPIKAIMQYLGYEVGKVRMPLGEMEEDNMKKLIDAVNNFGLKKVSE